MSFSVETVTFCLVPFEMLAQPNCKQTMDINRVLLQIIVIIFTTFCFVKRLSVFFTNILDSLSGQSRIFAV